MEATLEKKPETTLEKSTVPGLDTAIDIGMLDLAQAKFFKTEGGFMGLRVADKEYKRISLRRALPLKDPMSYISVADHENKEIGIIKSVSELTGEQFAIVVEELNRRYYCPEVLEIKSVKDKLGYVYMEMMIGAEEKGEGHCPEPEGRGHAKHPQAETPDKRSAVRRGNLKNAAVKDVNRNIRMLGDDRLIIFDVDGNRFIIPSLKELDKKSLKRLEPYLF